MTTSWTSEHVASIGSDGASPPVIVAGDLRAVPGLDLWDPWPVRQVDGGIARHDGDELWVALSCPASGHPGERHDRARLRLLTLGAGGARDLGDLFPPGASLGSREWAGWAEHDPAAGTVEVLYTAAGRRGEPRPTFEQRIVGSRGILEHVAGSLRPGGFEQHDETIRADGSWYLVAAESVGEPGFIKAFRYPFVFRDQRTDDRHLLFTASDAQARSKFSGAIGHAVATGDGPADWRLAAPLLSADGVNNELERPHIVARDGLLYLFFSTQARTFAPGLSGPTGLYGFVADDLIGPWVPLNGSGLVFRNPPSEPAQAYSWLVLDDLRVVSFVDSFAMGGRTPEQLEAEGDVAVRAHFGGAIAPTVEIELDGDRAGLAGVVEEAPVGRVPHS